MSGYPSYAAPALAAPGAERLPLSDTANRPIRKVFRRLLPILLLCYFVAFLDRVNVGFAAASMSRDLRFTSAVCGAGAGVFFIGYFLFEVPSNLALHRLGARIWIARIMITWGILAGLTSVVVALLGALLHPAHRLGRRGRARGDQLRRNLSGFLGPFLMGWIRDSTGSFTIGLLAIACGPALAAIALVPLRPSALRGPGALRGQ